MRVWKHFGVMAAVTFGLATVLASTGPAREPAVVKIGMLASMFRDVKPAMFGALAKPFYSMVEAQTGLKAELLLVPTANELRQRMDGKDIQFGVYHGFEFAWMQKKSPALQPIMIAAPAHRPLKAFLVVHASSTVKGFGDLSGQTVALPGGTREHVRLFAERRCLAEGKPLLTYFSRVTNPPNAEEALHDVADNKTVQAAVVDGAAIQSFRDRNPGRFKRLKIADTSVAFPESVVAFRQGLIADDVVRHFRDGMANAHTTPLGKQLLSLWAMTGFQPVPADYSQQLADIAQRIRLWTKWRRQPPP